MFDLRKKNSPNWGKNPKNCSKITKKSLFFPLFGKKSFLNRTLGLRKSFLNQTTYVLKNWLYQQSFLNRDSFLNRAFLNRDFTVQKYFGKCFVIRKSKLQTSRYAALIYADLIPDLFYQWCEGSRAGYIIKTYPK